MLKKIGMLVLFSTLISGCASSSGGWGDSGQIDNSLNAYECAVYGCQQNGPDAYDERQVYENQQKQQEFSQALKQFSEGLAQFGEEQRRRNNTNAYSYQPPALGYNSFMPSNEPSGYRSSTGRTYQYDLSDPRQRALYGADPAAKLRDRIEPDVLRRNDHNMGQYGGGILRNKRGAW
jgi:hypothetical protein